MKHANEDMPDLLVYDENETMGICPSRTGRLRAIAYVIEEFIPMWGGDTVWVFKDTPQVATLPRWHDASWQIRGLRAGTYREGPAFLQVCHVLGLTSGKPQFHYPPPLSYDIHATATLADEPHEPFFCYRGWERRACRVDALPTPMELQSLLTQGTLYVFSVPPLRVPDLPAWPSVRWRQFIHENEHELTRRLHLGQYVHVAPGPPPPTRKKRGRWIPSEPEVTTPHSQTFLSMLLGQELKRPALHPTEVRLAAGDHVIQVLSMPLDGTFTVFAGEVSS